VSRDLSDTVGLADDVSKSSVVSQDLTETVGLADSVSRSFAVSKDLTETVGLTDEISKSSAVSKDLTETAQVSDSISTLFISFLHHWDRKAIVIDSDLVDGDEDLTYLPILVKLTDDTDTLTNDSDLTAPKVGNNGEGIRFTSNGSTEIDFEIESFDGDTGTLTAWVEVPTVKHNEPTYFYIHYGKQDSTASTAAAVWAGKSYVVVNHLNDTPDSDNTTKDQVGSLAASGNSFNTWNLDSTNQVDGKIGKALSLNEGGVNDELICLEDTGTLGPCNGNGSIFDNAVCVRTSSLWYKADAVDLGDNPLLHAQFLFEEGGLSPRSTASALYHSELVLTHTALSNILPLPLHGPRVPVSSRQISSSFTPPSFKLNALPIFPST
jgi:hypothetical protein